jgi:hypothetical protein
VSKSDLERAFLTHWRRHGDGSEPEQEYRFAAHHVGGPGRGVRARLEEAGLRDWRFDFAWPDSANGVAVEIEGGTWSQGRHVRGPGFRSDCEKYNAATALCWRIFRCTGGMLRDDPLGFVEMVKEQLG